MKKSIFLLGMVSSLAAMQEDTQITRFDQKRAQSIMEGVRGLLGERRQINLDAEGAMPGGPANEPIPPHNDIPPVPENIVDLFATIDDLKNRMSPTEFELLFNRACNDVRMLNGLQNIDDPNNIDRALEALRLPIRAAITTLSATALPVATTKIMRGQVRSPVSIVSSLFGANFFYIGFALLFYLFYEARDWYKDLKIWWRGRRIDRLEQALGAIHTIEEGQRALQRRTDDLERAERNHAREIDQLAQTAQTLCEYIDGIALATEQAIEPLRPELAAIANDVGTLKALNQQIQSKLANSNELIATMREVINRLAASNGRRQ